MPWNHLSCLIVGFFVGDQYVKLEKKMLDDCNELRMDQGRPPFVGVEGWLPKRASDTDE